VITCSFHHPVYELEFSLKIAHTDSSSMGFVITFAGCPVAWTSKLQTEFALISTEAEFIVLSEGLRSTIPLIGMVTEFREKRVPTQLCMPQIHIDYLRIKIGHSIG
jgi:hypothetical protein